MVEVDQVRHVSRRPIRLSVALFIAAVLTAAAGCEAPGLDLAPVEGTVTLDGQPVAKAGVMFQPVESGPPAFGTTNAKGQFQLATANRAGALLGEHRVVITKTEITNLPRTPDGQVDELKLREVQELEHKNYLPARYSSPTTSELRATVNSSGNRFTFSLTSDESVSPPSDPGAAPNSAESADRESSRDTPSENDSLLK